MARQLDTATLDRAAKDYAGMFMADREPHDRDFVIQQFWNFTFKDEHAYVLNAIKGQLGPAAVKDFEALAETVFTPRDDEAFHGLLAEKLAVDPDGKHISGRVGTVQLGNRVVGRRVNCRGAVKNAYWPVYAGEGEERAADSGVADELPPGAEPLPLGALNTRISNEVALLMADACVDNLDEGTSAAIIRGYVGPQPADPDTAVGTTLLFTLVCSDPAFGAAVDANPGGRATASAITDDASADATGTLGYCRASSSNDGATPLDDHIDGEAGTAGADFNFNTLAIVSGATISMSSWTITMPEG